MNVLDNLANRASRMATDVQTSLKRARVEGERRLLQRQHRTALEELGERAFELVKDGTLPAEPLGPEVAAVESRLMEIEAKVTEIDAMGPQEEHEVGEPEAEDAPEDPSRRAFPMVSEQAPRGGPGPGWEAAERYFKRDP